MIQSSRIDEIRAHQTEGRERIVKAFVNAEEVAPKIATTLTKADFDEQYPESTYERYTAKTLNRFREDLSKAEDVDNKDDAFKKATEDLKAFVVHHEGKKEIFFTRKREAGE